MKSDKKHKNPSVRYVACENCGMDPVCRPVETGNQAVSFSERFLSRREPVSAGNALFAKGDKMTSLFAVSSGVFRIAVLGDDGQEQVLGFRFPGELLGDDALYSGQYAYTAIAVIDSTVCRMPVKDLYACGELVPAMQRNIIELMSRQSHVMQQQMSALVARKNAEQLLVAFLLNIAQRQAAHEGSATRIDLVVSRDSIANLLGLRRETLSRLLSRLQKKGLISLQGRRVELVDPEALAHLANQ